MTMRQISDDARISSSKEEKSSGAVIGHATTPLDGAPVNGIVEGEWDWMERQLDTLETASDKGEGTKEEAAAAKSGAGLAMHLAKGDTGAIVMAGIILPVIAGLLVILIAGRLLRR